MTNEVREKGGREMTSVAVKLFQHHRKREQLLCHLINETERIIVG